MIPDSYRALARYNRWMNEKIYAATSTLGDEERRRDRGADHVKRIAPPPALQSYDPRSWSIWSMVREGSAQPASPTTFAGTPATVTLLGTGLMTTEPAATRAQ